MRTLVAVAVFGGGIAHATLGPALRIADVAPDIPLIVVVLLALRRGPEFGCGAGFIAGLLQDAASGGLLGVQALTKAEGLARFALLKLFHFPAPFIEVMTYVVLPQALYNGFLGAALVLALTWAESMKESTT